jgi:hypothetical protein
MADPEQPTAPAEGANPLAPPPFTAQPGSIPGQTWAGAAPQQQYGWPPGYPPQQYQYGYGYGYPPQPPRGGTNGMAIAAMVCGICGFLCLVPGLVGIILGVVSLPQIKRSQQSGRGMAIAGIVTGSLWILAFVALIVFGNHSGQQIGNSGSSGGSGTSM